MRHHHALPPLLLVLTIGANAAPSAKPPVASPDLKTAKTVTRTDNDTGKPVSLDAGDTLIVRLKANATTGYAWQVTTPMPAYLTLKSSQYAADPHPPGFVGGGGIQTFRFYATPSQTAAQGTHRLDLRLVYRRSFDPRTVKPAQMWHAPVTVSQHEKSRTPAKRP